MIVGNYTPHSGLGNKMTQFASLFSLATDLGVQLQMPPISSFPLTWQQPQFSLSTRLMQNERPLPIPGRHYVSKQWTQELLGRSATSHRESYLENTYNFHRHRQGLLSVFHLPPYVFTDYSFLSGRLAQLKKTYVDIVRQNDLVISLRLGDFVEKIGADDRWRTCVYSRFLGFSYFRHILEQVNFDRLFLTSDEPFHPLTEEFDVYDPIRVKNECALKTMAFVGRFSKVAISESTFSWWASYLSDAEEIYFPISTNGLWGVNQAWDRTSASWRHSNAINARDADLYLRIDDDRYKYVHQTSGLIYRYRDAPGKRSEREFEDGRLLEG